MSDRSVGTEVEVDGIVVSVRETRNVAGHGKVTTASLVVVAFDHLGEEQTLLLGNSQGLEPYDKVTVTIAVTKGEAI